MVSLLHATLVFAEFNLFLKHIDSVNHVFNAIIIELGLVVIFIHVVFIIFDAVEQALYSVLELYRSFSESFKSNHELRFGRDCCFIVALVEDFIELIEIVDGVVKCAGMILTVALLIRVVDHRLLLVVVVVRLLIAAMLRLVRVIVVLQGVLNILLIEDLGLVVVLIFWRVYWWVVILWFRLVVVDWFWLLVVSWFWFVVVLRLLNVFVAVILVGRAVLVVMRSVSHRLRAVQVIV